MVSLYYEIWNFMIGKEGKYEFKDVLVWRARRAISLNNISILYGELTTSKPAYSYEEKECINYTAEEVEKALKDYGLIEFVQKRLKKKKVKESLNKWGFFFLQC